MCNLSEKPYLIRSAVAMRRATRQARQAGHSIGFVPTMGGLHEGHLALINMARNHADQVVVSLFVNPTQFAAGEDFATYPQDRAKDLTMLAEHECDMIWCPRQRDIYPQGNQTSIKPGALAEGMEALARPHFFAGVTEVVCRLFNHVSPDLAVFGEKDFQQLCVIKRMTTDLGLPVRILAAPTVREPDGLACSSRNVYLDAKGRKQAPALFSALCAAAAQINAGEPVHKALKTAKESIIAAGFSVPDYLLACDARTLVPWGDGPAPANRSGRILGAARLGAVRLIDNVPIIWQKPEMTG